jgi:hypothetical protein
MGITVRQLRDDLQSLVGNWLGSYTLANGAVTPAVAVRADSEGLDAGTKVSGLELVINRHPNIDPVRQYLSEGCSEVWEVWLLAWADGAHVTEAAALIVATYPGTTAQVVTLPEGWGPKRQVKLEIQNPLDLPLVLSDVDGGDFALGLPATLAAWVLDGGNFFDGSTLNTYTKAAEGGVIT